MNSASAPSVLSLHPGQLQLAFPIRRVPFQLAPQHASVLARSSSRSSLFQLASRPARGSLGGPVLQSSKPKGNSNSENMNRIWLFCKD
ncbi:hypothetical protein F2Q69_00052180 [Brassica cretica]|uniref:Uncharacterized protein n=1 Tax=Brassica cretica TaxID=69181 RepID=A0A8S9MTQ3_BRACR|nr:hypothetical protein F2Q69_00052180 [Brassica cretica]